MMIINGSNDDGGGNFCDQLLGIKDRLRIHQNASSININSCSKYKSKFSKISLKIYSKNSILSLIIILSLLLCMIYSDLKSVSAASSFTFPSLSPPAKSKLLSPKPEYLNKSSSLYNFIQLKSLSYTTTPSPILLLKYSSLIPYTSRILNWNISDHDYDNDGAKDDETTTTTPPLVPFPIPLINNKISNSTFFSVDDDDFDSMKIMRVRLS